MEEQHQESTKLSIEESREEIDVEKPERCNKDRHLLHPLASRGNAAS